jgi:hypothetical protein
MKLSGRAGQGGMILYHFTSFFALKNAGPDAILKAGLKAHDQSKNYPWVPLPACVWLTSDPQPPVLFDRMPQCRITVELSTASKRLVSWPKWLRRHNYLELVTEAAKQYEPLRGLNFEDAWRYWYVYFGDVPLKAFRAVEHASPERRAEAERGETPPA